MRKRILALIPLGAVLALGLPAPPSGAAVAYRTTSGQTRICSPQGFESTTTFSDVNVGNVRLAQTPVVVQTGVAPAVGPGLPVSLLTGATGDVGPNGEQGYRFRAFDQNGATVAGRPSATNCYTYAYHASIPFSDAARAAGNVYVNTDARGIAVVRFPHRLATAPVSVIATGAGPYFGPELPLNLVTSGYSPAGFAVRALDQAGQPIVSRLIRLHYWATAQAATPNTRAGAVLVNPNTQGVGQIAWPLFAKGLPPVSVVLTGKEPTSGPNMPVNLLAFGPQNNAVTIRILNQAGQPITTPVWIAFYATKASVSTL
jgi:hypothetical protein